MLEYLGLSPVSSVASNISMTTADSLLSDLSSTEVVTQSASTHFDRENSTSGSPLKPWRQIGTGSRGLGSSRGSKLTDSAKSPIVRTFLVDLLSLSVLGHGKFFFKELSTQTLLFFTIESSNRVS